MIITIARQCGCAALSVGRLLAAHYNVPLYTRQTLLEKAKSKGMYEEMYDFFSEQPIDYLAMAATSQSDATEEVRRRFARAINVIVGEEDCIIVGRCGNVLFEGRQDLFSIFLHGDREQRIRNIAAEKGIDNVEAEEVVDTTDDCRASYHRYYTGHTWGHAADYLLSIDTLRLGTSLTAELIEKTIGE